MKPGDLIKVPFISSQWRVETKIGIVLDFQYLQYLQDNPEKIGTVKMLCTSGEIREFIMGYGEDVVIV